MATRAEQNKLAIFTEFLFMYFQCILKINILKRNGLKQKYFVQF